MKNLPEEVITKILLYLDREDIGRVSLICKKWENVINKRSSLLGLGIRVVTDINKSKILYVDIENKLTYHDQCKMDLWIPFMGDNNMLSIIKYDTSFIMNFIEQVVLKIYNNNKRIEINLLHFLSKIMNATITHLIADNNMLKLSIFCYNYLYDLLSHFIIRYPILKEYVNSSVKKFINSEEFRHKKYCFSIGELFTSLLLSDYNWEDIKQVLISEVFDRNSFLILVEHPYLDIANKFKIYKSKSRINKSYNAVKITNKLVMFHKYFLEKLSTSENYYDYINDKFKLQSIENDIENINNINNFYDFMSYVDFMIPHGISLNSYLIHNIINMYHKNYNKEMLLY